MPYPPNQIPDAPVPVSMFPEVAMSFIEPTDMLYLIRTSNPAGQRCFKVRMASVSGYVLQNNSILAPMIAAGSVTTQKLGNGAVTTDKIAGSAVNESKIADGSVSWNKLSSDLHPAVVPTTGVQTSVELSASDASATMAEWEGGIGRLFDVTIEFTMVTFSTSDFSFQVKLYHDTASSSPTLTQTKTMHGKNNDHFTLRFTVYDSIGGLGQGDNGRWYIDIDKIYGITPDEIGAMDISLNGISIK